MKEGGDGEKGGRREREQESGAERALFIYSFVWVRSVAAMPKAFPQIGKILDSRKILEY